MQIQWQNHFTNGGTGIVKFSHEDIQTYTEAIRRYGDKDLFLKGDELHIKNGIKELGAFWRVFEDVKAGK